MGTGVESNMYLPSVQLKPVQPSSQVHNPSVLRHLLQLRAQLKEQFSP